MPQLPPVPGWDAMHPLLIHFPIVLLLLAPLFVLIATILRPPRNRPYMTVALIMLLLGTLSLFFAASSGEEAAELADRDGGINAIISTHQALASTCEIFFSVLSACFAGIYIWPRVSRRLETRIISTVVPLVFVCLYSLGLLYLINTAHAGGRLVHEFGVHAMMPQDTTPAAERVPSKTSEAGKGD